MINRLPYKDGDKHVVDVDPDDKHNYVFDVRQDVIDSDTSVLSFTMVTSDSVDVLLKDDPQGERNGLLPVKMQVSFDGDEQPYATARFVTEDQQQFDRTMWFKQVQK